MAKGQLILDRYETLGTAGAGGFGTVRIAWDQRIQRKVAIKTIELSEIDAWRAGLPGADAVANAPLSNDEPSANRWRGIQPWDEYLAENGVGWPGEDVRAGIPRDELKQNGVDEPFTSLAHVPGLDEARTAAKLQDQRIVGVFDFEVRGQVAYLIMEYVEGITLTKLLSQYEDYLTLDVVATIFDAVAGALSVAHKAGVLHLDIKPDNILINAEGQVKVTDFGLATLADASGTGLAGGGTIGYMPLEQMRREPLDARTDEWALASVTYEMLTGDNPFRVDSLEHAEAAIEDAELVLPSLCWESIDEQIDDVIFFALDPERDERYASVSDFAEEARKFLGDPAAGKRQLSFIVQDALGMLGDEEDQDYDEEYDEDFLAHSRRLKQLGTRFSSNPNAHERLVQAAARTIIAAIAAYLGFSAMQGVYQLAPLLGRGATLSVSVVFAVIAAVLGAVLPHAGILVVCLLEGFALIAANQIITGIALIVAGLAWCYASTHRSLRDNHPLLLCLTALVCIGCIIAALVFTQPAREFVAPAVAVASIILVDAARAFMTRR